MEILNTTHMYDGPSIIASQHFKISTITIKLCIIILYYTCKEMKSIVGTSLFHVDVAFKFVRIDHVSLLCINETGNE